MPTASLKSTCSAYYCRFDMDQVTLKVDSKGRICLPVEIRGEIGNVAILKKTPAGYLIVPGRETDFLKEIRQVITTKHERTGKPENWSSEKMKAVWSKPEKKPKQIETAQKYACLLSTRSQSPASQQKAPATHRKSAQHVNCISETLLFSKHS